MSAAVNGFTSNVAVVTLLVNFIISPFEYFSENSIDTGFVQICAVRSSPKPHRVLEKSDDNVFTFTLLCEIFSCNENISLSGSKHMPSFLELLVITGSNSKNKVASGGTYFRQIRKVVHKSIYPPVKMKRKDVIAGKTETMETCCCVSLEREYFSGH